MSTVLDITLLVLGIAILYWGAEWLIRGSASLARAIGVKPLVIGLTVVAYGTCAPELAVATKTALAHSQPIALGTVIGSCAANISLILGLTALISPPTVDGRIIRREVPVLVGSAIAVPILFRNGVLSRLEGGLLVALRDLFTIVTLTVSARLDPDDRRRSSTRARRLVGLDDARADRRGERRRDRRHGPAARRADLGDRDDDVWPRPPRSPARYLFVRGGRGIARRARHVRAHARPHGRSRSAARFRS